MLELFKHNKMLRLFLGYRFFSAIGSGMFRMFVLFSVHLIYNNPMYTGVASFLMIAPFVSSFTVGPIVDKRNKVAIMRLTILLEFVVLLFLTVSSIQEDLSVLFMFAAVLLFSVAALFEGPASSALLPQIVPYEKIIQANSLIMTSTMVGGLGVAIILYVALGVDIDFGVIYGLSTIFLTLAFIFSLLLKKTESKVQGLDSAPQNYIQELKEGAKFIRGSVLLYIMIATTAMGMFIEIASVNRPMFLNTHVGAQGYVVFSVLALVGGILGSSIMARAGNKFRASHLISALLMLSGIARIVFAYVLPHRVLAGALAMIIYATLGSSLGIVFTSLNQKTPPKNMVGRIVTISTTCRSIFISIGSIVGGFLGSVMPVVDHIFVLHGISYILIGLFMSFVPSVRTLSKMDEVK